MPANEFPIKITGDVSELTKATNDAKDQLDNASKSVEMLGEMIGVKVPESIQKMIASSKLVGPVLAEAFPVLAIISFAKSIFEASEKVDKHAEAMQKAKERSIELAESFDRQAESIQISNLRLQDQIATLTKHPAQNGPKIAAIEAKAQIDELISSLNKALAAEQSLFKANIDNAFMAAIGKGTGEASTIASHFYQGLQQMRQYYDDWHRYQNIGDQDNADKYKHLFEEKEQGLKDFAKESIQTLKDIQTAAPPVVPKNQLSSDPERAKAQQYAITEAYQKQKDAAATLQPIVENLYGTFLQGEAQVKAAVQNGAAKQVVSGLEQAIKNYDLLKTKSEQTLNEQIAGFKTQEAVAVESFVAQGATMEEAKAKAEAIYGPQILQAHLDFYAKMGAAAVTQAEKDRLAGEAHIALDQAVQQADESLAQSETRFHGIQDQQHKEEMQREAQAGKQAMDLAAKRNKELLEQFELMQSLGDKRIETIDKELVALQKLIASGKLNADTTAAAYGRIHQLEIQRQKDLAQDMIATGKLGQAMHGTFLEIILDSQNVNQKLVATFKNAMDSMNHDLAQFVATGKANWLDLAVNAIESIVEILAQQAEAWAAAEILDAMGLEKKKDKNASEAESSTNTAAANTLADVPFPENIGASATVEAIGQGFTIGAKSSAGGDWRVDRDRLNFVHANETILPAGIAGKLRDMVEGGSTGSGVTLVVNHSVSAVDAASFQGHIRRHSNMIANEVTRALKRKGAR